MSVYIQKEKKVEKKFDGPPGEHIRGRHRTGPLSPLSAQRAFHLRKSSQNADFKFKSWKNRGKQGAIPVFFASVFRPDGLPLSWRDGIQEGAWFSTVLHQGVSIETVFLSSKSFHDFSTIFPRFVSRNMKNHHISRRMKNGDFELKNGAPGGTRTHDPLLRRQMLYPAELPEHIFCFVNHLLDAARGLAVINGGIRTRTVQFRGEERKTICLI